jgi:hypothetical protein
MPSLFLDHAPDVQVSELIHTCRADLVDRLRELREYGTHPILRGAHGEIADHLKPVYCEQPAGAANDALELGLGRATEVKPTAELPQAPAIGYTLRRGCHVRDEVMGVNERHALSEERLLFI